MNAVATIVEAGVLTTVQDGGRWGYQHLGISVSGAMDTVSMARANRLVGNAPTAAALEVTLVGPAVAFEDDTRIAVSGADFDVTLDEHPVSRDTVLGAGPGQVLAFGRRRAGARAYVAFAGGIALPPVFGSRSTHLPSGLGGLDGRALRSGDTLPVGERRGTPIRPAAAVRWRPSPGIGGVRVRVLPAAHAARFDTEARAALFGGRFVVSSQSDRMGYRLDGPPIPIRESGPLLSCALPLGALQVLPSGGIIVAMADRQTSGGYPRIATVITADAHRLGQLAPGDWVEFVSCDPDEARAALAEQDDGMGFR